MYTVARTFDVFGRILFFIFSVSLGHDGLFYGNIFYALWYLMEEKKWLAQNIAESKMENTCTYFHDIETKLNK